MNYMTGTGKVVTRGHIKAMHAALVEFGYTGLKIETVESAVAKIASNEPTPGVIDRFVRKFLEDAGLVA